VFEISINPWAIAVATVLSFVLGGAWYTLFSKPWMRALGINRNDVRDAGLSMSRAVVASLISGAVLSLTAAWLLAATGVVGLGAAIGLGAACWVGFNFTSFLKLRYWEDRPRTLLLIDVALFSVVVIFLVPLWGGRWDNIVERIGWAVSGVQIGGRNFSPAQVLMGVAVFVGH